MKRILYLIFLVSLFSTHHSLGAQRQLTIKDSENFYEVGPFLDILEDPSGKLTIDDVTSSQYTSLFKPNKQKVPNFGFSPSAHWARFYLKNLSRTKKEWLLSFNYYNQDEVTFYKKENSKWSSLKTGDLYPVSSREIKERPFLFKINPEYPGPYFIKIKGSDNQLDLTLGTSLELGSRESIENYLLGLFFGLSLAMAAFNLFVYLTTRSPAHLYYVLYVISAGLFLANDFGYVLRYLTPNTPWFSNNGQALFAGLFQFFILKFVISFLKLKETTPNLYLANSFFVLTSFCLIISSFIFPFSFNVLYLAINPLMFFFLIFFTGFYRIRMNYRPAKYFVSAFLFTLLGGIILIFVVAGILPSTTILRKALVIGHGIDLILLSMGLADKFNLIQEESLNHAKKAKSLQEQMTKYLEEEVKKQTKKLKIQNEELKLMDERKTNFFQNISHELRTPLTLIMSPLEDEFHENPDNENLQIASKSSRRLHQLVNQLLDIQKITAGKQKHPF